MTAPADDVGLGGVAVTRQSGTLMRWATYASLSVAGVLTLAKLGAWLATDSVSLLSTLVDSMLDIALPG